MKFFLAAILTLGLASAFPAFAASGKATDAGKPSAHAAPKHKRAHAAKHQKKSHAASKSQAK